MAKGDRRLETDDVDERDREASGHFIGEVRVTFNSASLPV
jgi:hypothetical protein